MINPIYKFEITSVYGQTIDNKTVYPIYKSDLAIDWQIEQNEQYYRGKLSGKLNFIGDDFDFINSKNFETEFELRILISYNAGASWTQYWTGKFCKTDCEFDVDAKTISVTPVVNDDYTDVLAGMDKEFNLIDLAPELEQVYMDKRPMLQIYTPGDSRVGCFLSGMYWEQDCTEVDNIFELEDTYNFAQTARCRRYDVSGGMIPILPPFFYGKWPLKEPFSLSVTEENYTLTVWVYTDGVLRHEIRQGQTVMWRGDKTAASAPYNVTLTPISDSGASGNVTLSVSEVRLYARMVLDVDEIRGVQTYPITSDDMVGDNRNYTRVVGRVFEDAIVYYNGLTTGATKYGIYQPGMYYAQPEGKPNTYPIAKSQWGRLSIWFDYPNYEFQIEEAGRKRILLKNAYPIDSVIRVILGQIAPNIQHYADIDCSEFLYGLNDIRAVDFDIFLTPKSNILAGDYDHPAQKAPITLRMVTNMLRNCFRCFWFIGSDTSGNKVFRIEHIEYFERGGSYAGNPIVGRDLTIEQVTRSGKKWSFGQNQFTFDKQEMPERYQFSWMDDVTQPFDGYPIDVKSRYVSKGIIEEVRVNDFTSDVDFMLLSPESCSEDGFALLGVIEGLPITIGSGEQGTYYDVNGDKQTIEDNYWFTYKADISQYAGKEIEIRFYATVNKYTLFVDSSNNVISAFQNATAESSRSLLIPYGCKWVLVTNNIFYTTRPSVIVGVKSLPYRAFETYTMLQNGYMAFDWLQRYYLYDLPASNIEINGVPISALGVKRLKEQSVKFHALYDVDTKELIKTGIGEGKIKKISVNLSSRSSIATLSHDTEQ